MKEFPDTPDKRARWTSGLEPAGKKKPKMKLGKGLLYGAMGLAAVAAVTPKSVEGTSDKDTATSSSTIPLDAAGLRGKIFTDLDEVITDAQKRLRSPEVLTALSGEGEQPFSRVSEVIGISLSEALPYNVAELQGRYPVQIVRHAGEVSLLPTTLGESRDFFGDSAAGAGYGNGVYWGDARTILTADHVLGNVIEREKIGYPRRNPDIALLSVPERFAASDPAQIVHDDPRLTNSDIEGALVSIVGIDPDAFSDPLTGKKADIGLAARISPGMARILARGDSQWERLFAKSFMMVLPSGAAQNNPKTGNVVPSAGESGAPVFCNMSGSPVFAHRDGKDVFCGIFWGVSSMLDEKTGRVVDIGLFFGIDEVREGISKATPYAVE